MIKTNMMQCTLHACETPYEARTFRAADCFLTIAYIVLRRDRAVCIHDVIQKPCIILQGKTVRCCNRMTCTCMHACARSRAAPQLIPQKLQKLIPQKHILEMQTQDAMSDLRVSLIMHSLWHVMYGSSAYVYQMFTCPKAFSSADSAVK